MGGSNAEIAELCTSLLVERTSALAEMKLLWRVGSSTCVSARARCRPTHTWALLLADVGQCRGSDLKNPEASVKAGRDAKRLKEARITRSGFSDDLTTLSLLHRRRWCERRWGHCRVNGVLEVLMASVGSKRMNR